MKQLRERAHMTVFQLAMKSEVSIRTINRIENEEEHYVTSLTAQKLVDTLSEKLGQQINIEDVEGLKIKE
jgi:DNA-binding XRE family transcriptional regulator